MDTTTNLSRNILSLINLNLNALIREPLIHSLANTKEMAFRDAFLLNISNDPYVVSVHIVFLFLKLSRLFSGN